MFVKCTEHVCQACLSQISISYISLWPLAERGLDIKKKNLNPKRNGEIDKTRGSRQFLLNILWGYDADTGNTNVHFPVQRVFWFQLRCMYADVWHAQKRVATGRVDSQLGFFSCFSHRASTTGSFGCDTRFIHFLAAFVFLTAALWPAQASSLTSAHICIHPLHLECHLSPFPIV